MVKASGYGKIENVGFKNQGHASASYIDRCNSVLLQLSLTCLSVVLNFPLHTVLPHPLKKSSTNIKLNAVPETRENLSIHQMSPGLSKRVTFTYTLLVPQC